VAGGLRAGATYTLRIDAGTDGAAEGTTTLPRDFVITSPAAGTQIVSAQPDTTAPSYT
jgi:hypothetical protein